MPSTEQIIVMATLPIIKILVMCGIGYIIAAPPINAFPSDARKHMNKLVFYIFLPSLIFTRLSEAVTSQKLIDWWFMPFNVAFSFAVGALLGLVVIKFTNPSSHLENVTIACCAAGNTGNIPLVLIPGICKEDNNPFGESLSCSLNGVAYVSFAMWMATLLVWTFIYNLLVPQTSSIEPNTALDESEQKTNEDVLINKGKSIQNETCTKEEANVHEMDKPINATALSNKHGIGDQINEKWALLQNPKSENGFELTTSTFTSTSRQFMSMLNKVYSSCTKDSAKVYVRQIFTPPITAAILALIIGGCVTLKPILIGPHAPLSFLVESLSILGDATIPCMNLILGGNLVSGMNASNLKFQTLIGILLTRFLFLPIIGYGLVNSASSLKLIPKDPLFRFVLLLQFCMPTAINVGTIAQLHGSSEMEISKILLWSYATSVVLLTVWIIVFLSTI